MKHLTAAVLSALFVLVGCGGGTNGSQQASQANVASSPAAQKFTLSDNEEKLLRDLLDNDIETFFSEGDTVLGEFLPRYTPDEISKDFEQNEVRALSKYKDKYFGVVGRVADIQAGLNDEPFVVLRTSNQFNLNAPHAGFDKDNLQKVADLSKGDTVHLFCLGNGEVAGTPLMGCIFSDEFKSTFADNVITNIRDGSLRLAEDARPSENMAVVMLVSVKAAAEYTDNFKSCAPNYETKCLNQSAARIPRERLAAKASEYGFSELAERISSSVSQPK